MEISGKDLSWNKEWNVGWLPVAGGSMACASSFLRKEVMRAGIPFLQLFNVWDMTAHRMVSCGRFESELREKSFIVPRRSFQMHKVTKVDTSVSFDGWPHEGSSNKWSFLADSKEVSKTGLFIFLVTVEGLHDSSRDGNKFPVSRAVCVLWKQSKTHSHRWSKEWRVFLST